MDWDKVVRTSILCLGDVMFDTFVFGHIERISPEAPVPVFKKIREFSVLGGSGNVVRNLSSLGCQVSAVGLVGMDNAGEEVSNFFNQLENCTPILIQEGGRKTPHKVRYICQGQQVLRVDEETALPLSEPSAMAITEALLHFLPHSQAVILSDYAKGLLETKLCEKVISAARSLGIPVIVDPKGVNYNKYSGATVISPNLKELRQATQQECQNQDEIVIAAQKLRADLQVDYVLVTRSHEGMTLVSQQEIHHFSAEAREIYDVSGAGDTVAATLSLALAVGYTVCEAANLANKAAGIVVGKAGTAVVTPEELSSTISMTLQNKVMSLDQALIQVGQWRREERRIGFTNGCFDLLHRGHLHILNQARQACDRLIIGLNTDSSVKRLKGEERPIQNESTRAEVLAALSCVDGVVLFDEDTPLNLITQILPDVLIKGADYRIDQVVGADIVRANGGAVLLAELLPGNSTTSTINKMMSAA